MATKKETIKINKNHGGKEFRSYFRFIGQAKPVRKKEDGSENWVDQPLYEETLTKTKKPRRVLQFNIETAMGNELKVEIAGMEQEYAYPYSSTHKKAHKIAWKDRLDKSKYPDDTYHYIDTDWDKAKKYSEIVKVGEWYEVRGYYEPQEFKNSDGKDIISVKRIISSIRPIVNGRIVEKEGEEPKPIKHAGEEFDYVCDFKADNFKEVNYVTMQIGIKSTYQNEDTKDTKVNAVLLTYGKERSEPKDVELMVYYSQPEQEGSIALADAFASLEKGDFIEIIGQDNNRATFTYVDVEEVLDDGDPFSKVGGSQKVTRKERVVSGDKKGLEITGYVAGSIIRGLLTDDELKKSEEINKGNNPFDGGVVVEEDFEDSLPF